ncbi:MAG: nuclear transport factor 2 family protein [Cyclobacteriaceae bacterium]
MKEDLIEIGTAYLRAFSEADFKKAREYVTDDFHFKGSIDEFHSADQAFEAFTNVGPMINGIDIISAFSNEGEACFIYLFRCKPPIGHVPTVEYMKFSDERIHSSRIFYDPHSFEAIMELPSVKTSI